jgi:hypothetical protein
MKLRNYKRKKNRLSLMISLNIEKLKHKNVKINRKLMLL